jgi:hypothetical protein
MASTTPNSIAWAAVPCTRVKLSRAMVEPKLELKCSPGTWINVAGFHPTKNWIRPRDARKTPAATTARSTRSRAARVDRPSTVTSTTPAQAQTVSRPRAELLASWLVIGRNAPAR